MLIFMETEKSTAFGERLKWARKRAKLTQQTASNKVGMSQGTLAELERNGQGSSYTSALAALYSVNSVWLATGKGDPLKGSEVLTRISFKDDGQVPPSPETYAKVVQLFGEASGETRGVVLKILQNEAAKRSRRRDVIGNNEAEATGGDGGA